MSCFAAWIRQLASEAITGGQRLRRLHEALQGLSPYQYAAEYA